MRLIDADALREHMYHEAFETDSDMQKWDSGCWIRYKMFENIIDTEITVDAVEVVRCKNCRNMVDDGYYPHCYLDGKGVDENWYCASGQRGKPYRRERKHGHWYTDSEGAWVCSECGWHTWETDGEWFELTKEEAQVFGWKDGARGHRIIAPKYCARCGAKMNDTGETKQAGDTYSAGRNEER